MSAYFGFEPATLVGLARQQGAFGAINASRLALSEKVLNQEAVDLSPSVGWLMLLGGAAVFLLLVLNSERWRRWWLTMEDPRAQGLYRIVFGVFVVANVNDFYEYWTMLFTDEGIFTADVAREVYAAAQFKGFGDGFTEESPWGFFDARGVWEFLKGPKWSVLYFWDSPTALWLHILAFHGCAVLFIVGLQTRVAGVLTFLLMNSLLVRNYLFWEGTEVVFRVYLAYLICARSGHAFSVDNWLRCRKLRKRGLLSVRGGLGNGAGYGPCSAHPQGLQPIYRLIPAWPRRLALVQLAATYTTTGILKNGNVWAQGDAVYYALNMDHFYRFYPQQVSAWLGTNILRVATWFAHWGEVFFFLGAIGVLVRWSATERVPPVPRWVKSLRTACQVTVVLVTASVIWVTWPVHFTPDVPRLAFAAGWTLLLLGGGGLWAWVGRRPLRVRGRTGVWLLWLFFVGFVALILWLLAFPLVPGPQRTAPAWVWRKAAIVGCWSALATLVPWATTRFAPARVAAIRRFFRIDGVAADEFLERKHDIDRRWIATWVLGRRVWLTWHIMLMGGIFAVMNIGQFQTGMLSQTLVFLYGAEAAAIVNWLMHRIRLRPHGTPVPAEDPTLPHLHRDRAVMPRWALLTGLIIFLSGVLVRVLVNPAWDWRWIWAAGMGFLAVVGIREARRHGSTRLPPSKPVPHRFPAPDGNALVNEAGASTMPWAYGPLGRFATSAVILWHMTAVAVWLMPDKDCLSTWRGSARKVFATWLTTTQTDQGWGMFAPNPPRTNVFLKVLVTDDAGETFDLKTDVYAPERKPIPWVWNDRMRKMNRRIIGGESGNTKWYRKWYARYICRKWALDHGGAGPQKVELVKVWYRIPPPEETLQKGYYDPQQLLERAGVEKLEHTEQCKTTVMGQLPNWIRERHALPPLDEDGGWKYKPWLKHKKRKWERMLENEEE